MENRNKLIIGGAALLALLFAYFSGRPGKKESRVLKHEAIALDDSVSAIKENNSEIRYPVENFWEGYKKPDLTAKIEEVESFGSDLEKKVNPVRKGPVTEIDPEKARPVRGYSEKREIAPEKRLPEPVREYPRQPKIDEIITEQPPYEERKNGRKKPDPNRAVKRVKVDKENERIFTKLIKYRDDKEHFRVYVDEPINGSEYLAIYVKEVGVSADNPLGVEILGTEKGAGKFYADAKKRKGKMYSEVESNPEGSPSSEKFMEFHGKKARVYVNDYDDKRKADLRSKIERFKRL